jgi:hypothetical protein
MIDPDAAAFAAAFAADPTDDDTLDHHAARMFSACDEYAYLSEVAEFWPGHAHAPCNGLCSSCRRFYGDLEAASIALDLAVAEEHPAPDWRQFQEDIWAGRLDDTIRASVAFA